MATAEPVRKFAEQAIRIERLLDQHKVNRSLGRVALILAAATKAGGITQKQVVETTGIAKDVVSKTVGSLVKAGLLIQNREEYDPRVKRLCTSSAGKSLLGEIKAVLRPASPAANHSGEPVVSRPTVLDILGEVAE